MNACLVRANVEVSFFYVPLRFKAVSGDEAKFAGFSHDGELKCQSGSDHYSAVAQLVFANGSALARIPLCVKTVRLSTFAILISLALTGPALCKEKDQDEAESRNDVTIEKVTLGSGTPAINLRRSKVSDPPIRLELSLN